jgi:hypothetical protein
MSDPAPWGRVAEALKYLRDSLDFVLSRRDALATAIDQQLALSDELRKLHEEQSQIIDEVVTDMRWALGRLDDIESFLGRSPRRRYP